MRLSRHISTLAIVALTVWAMPATAQQPSSPSGTTGSVPGSQNPPPTGAAADDVPTPGAGGGSDVVDAPGESGGQPAGGKAADTFSVEVTVRDGVQEKPLAGKGVVVKASRARGPFEPTEPTAQATREGVTNQQGVAEIDGLPRSVARQGLELYAVVTDGGIDFKSPRVPAAPGAKLDIEVYPRAPDASSVRIEKLRTVVEPWEGYLVFSQFYTLTVEGNRAVDTTMLPGERFEDGLPIELPTKAKGIHVNGRGNTKVVDSTVNWKGVLRPGESFPLRLRYSMSINSADFVYRQSVDYPVDNLEVVIPLETEHEKISRLTDVALKAPGFESLTATRDVPGFRRDQDYLFATGRTLESGEAFAFKLTGLPFGRSMAPWLTLGLGLFGVVFVLLFGLRRGTEVTSKENRSEAIAALEEQKEALLEELAELEEAWEQGNLSELTYETDALHLREQLSLVMKKLNELRDQA